MKQLLFSVKWFSGLILILLLQLSQYSSTIAASKARPDDADVIQARMQQLINYLDSPEYAAMVTRDEHIVLAFKRARGRMPRPLEMFTIDALQKDISLKRSDILSIALRGKQKHPDWAQCRHFIQQYDRRHFLPERGARNIARQLRRTPRSDLLEMFRQDQRQNDAVDTQSAVAATSTALAHVSYNTYYGYLHSHSELSDGTGSPAQAYDYARYVGELDFFGLTDHGEQLIIWPWNNKWARLVSAAHAANADDSFVSLWGFEWSNPFLGHINILNTSDYTHALSNFWLGDIYNWIAARGQSFARLNHPGEYDDLGLEFYHFLPYAPVVPQIVGIETWNGNNSFDIFHYAGGYSSAFAYLDEANQRGWLLGSLGGQDNHAGAWGTSNQFRTAVLATRLTRADIIDAYRNRRFYATEDKDLRLDVRVQGLPMGSIVPAATPRLFEVSVCDDGGDSFQQVRLYRNGVPVSSQSLTGNCAEATLTDVGYTGQAYYYVMVRQNDDNDGNGRNDEAMSSPIWFK